MISLFFFVFLIGAGLIGFGIWDQKRRFGSQQFTEGEIVGYQSAVNRSASLMGAALNAAAGMVSPVAKVTLASGEVQQIRLHTQLPKLTIDKFPDLQIGGKVSLIYFGDHPREVFLVGHPLAQKPLRVSPALLIGIPVLIVGVILTVVYFTS